MTIPQLDPVTRRHVERATDTLCEEFAGTFSRETIDRFVSESTEQLGRAHFNDFVPLLAYRFARERLRAFGQAEGMITKEVPEVLFVCVRNAGRSQMAAALMSQRGKGRIHVRSAGSDPGERVNPAVASVLEELGLDLSEAFPKPMTDEVVRAADAVVTMGCGDACPIYQGKLYEDWEVADPEGKSLEQVRAIRDEIDRRVQELLEKVTS